MSAQSSIDHSKQRVVPFRESLLAMFGVSFVTMLVALDQTVVGTALPTIVAELHGFQFYAWVATAYLLSSVATIPIFGRLGDYYGRKPFLIMSIVVFTGASALCGMANSMLLLVVFRCVQGVGGGMLVGTAFACVPDLFPDAVVRLRWQVIMSASFGVANAIGPSLGGVLTQYYGWRSVFYVNLPIGLLAFWFVSRHLPYQRPMERGRSIQLDWPGALLIALTLGAFQLLVEGLPKNGPGLRQVALLILTLASAVALWKWERRAAEPILPLDMFANQSLATLFRLSVLSGFVSFTLVFYAPLMFQGGFGMAPKEAGAVITPLVVCLTIGTTLNARIILRVRNPNAMFYIGFSLLALACLGMATSTRNTAYGLLVTIMVTAGLGLGFALANQTTFTQQTADRQHLGIATALLQSLRMVGGMIGTAVTGTIVNQAYASRLNPVLMARDAMQWHTNFLNPQFLVDPTERANLLARLWHGGQDGVVLIDAAREALVGAIHVGFAVCCISALCAVWQSSRVPPLTFQRKVRPAMATTD
jgi:EmrB/QacA subfamily drug resistance transporter